MTGPYPGPTGPQYPGPQNQGPQNQGPQYHGAQPPNPYAQYSAPAAGPPPQKPNRTVWWVAGAAVVLVLVVAVAAVAVVLTRDTKGGTDAAPSTITTEASCGLPGESPTVPITDRVVAGPLSFPVSAAPTWIPQDYTAYAQSALAQGLRDSIPGQSWQAHAEIGLTTFTSKITSAEAARRMVPCIAAGAGYARYSPRVEGLTEPQAVTVDGVAASRVTARVLVQKEGLNFPGDIVTVVVIDSAPQAYFMSDTPIGDEARAAVAQQIFDQLKVARDV
ncbi:hypothetical protein TSST111916_12175 [Tsukamurella strandjordii]|uniref:hypothetical protein n=1 Tax=Tsukamurella TaxID=2060 RepID=UPI001C7CB35C|nr:hypothetical protein [Tsukamurella sp. TY48]GIZ96504.1 hypothetical protein TTY48_11160 [Tsukamurella sp. TY48]